MASDAALHEAAHAVAAVVLQRDFRAVSIVPRGDYAGRIVGLRRAGNDSPEGRRQLAVIIDASLAAEVYRRRRRGEPLPSEKEMRPLISDGCVLERFEAIDGEAALQAAIEEALELVVEHWDAVLRVADALDARKMLSHRQVTELVTEQRRHDRRPDERD
jgi:hypothetical protein